MTQKGLNEGRLRERGLRFKTALGQLTHIETQEANDDETIDFTEVFTDDYDRYVAFIDNFLPRDDRDNPFIRLSSDGGSTWDSGTSDYGHSHFRVREDGSTASFGDGADDRLQITNQAVQTDPNENDTGGYSITISDPTNSSRSTVVRASSAEHRHDATAFASQIGGGIRLSQSSVDSIQFLVLDSEGGAISSGIFSVYGVDK